MKKWMSALLIGLVLSFCGASAAMAAGDPVAATQDGEKGKGKDGKHGKRHPRKHKKHHRHHKHHGKDGKKKGKKDSA